MAITCVRPGRKTSSTESGGAEPKGRVALAGDDMLCKLAQKGCIEVYDWIFKVYLSRKRNNGNKSSLFISKPGVVYPHIMTATRIRSKGISMSDHNMSVVMKYGENRSVRVFWLIVYCLIPEFRMMQI